MVCQQSSPFQFGLQYRRRIGYRKPGEAGHRLRCNSENGWLDLIVEPGAAVHQYRRLDCIMQFGSRRLHHCTVSAPIRMSDFPTGMKRPAGVSSGVPSRSARR